MTAFHDAILDLNPIMFVPFDGPNDDATHAYDLMGHGAFVPGSGGTRQVSAGTEVQFDYELALDGVTEYWTADSALTAWFAGLFAGTISNFTVLIWWRSTNAISDSRYLLRFANSGFYIRRSSGSIEVNIIANTTISYSVFRSGELGESSGGWQHAALVLDATEDQLFVCRNGHRMNSIAVPDSTSIRRQTTYSLQLGKNGTSGSDTWLGSLGPVAMFSRVLTPEELTATFDAGFTVESDYNPTPMRPLDTRMRTGVLTARRAQ